MFFTCRGLSRNVERLEDPTVPVLHRWLGRGHLLWCRNCSRFVKQYRTTVLALKQLQTQVPEQNLSALVAFRAWRRRA